MCEEFLFNFGMHSDGCFKVENFLWMDGNLLICKRVAKHFFRIFLKRFYDGFQHAAFRCYIILC